MLSAALLEDGIELTFADGLRGLVPYAAIPEITGISGVSALDLPNPYEAIILTDEGQQVDLPWDFARHYCDQSYRPTVEAIARQGRQTLGERIRQFRESAGFTQEALAALRRHRKSHLGQAGKRRADTQIQDPDRHSPSIGKAGSGLAH